MKLSDYFDPYNIDHVEEGKSLETISKTIQNLLSHC